MRRAPLTAVLLIAIFTASASACVSAWGSNSTASPTSCHRQNAGRSCAHKRMAGVTAKRASCPHDVKSQPAKCSLRSFLHLQFVMPQAAAISIPYRRLAAVNAPRDAVIIVSSIGSPETDRGPPLS
jgi:hypothetical protein